MAELSLPSELPPPALPLRVRRAARVLVLDEAWRLLLMHDSDLGLPGRPDWWITPGGGIDGDETPVQAAVRELAEETGLAVAADQLLGPVWHRPAVSHTFSDHRSRQEEFFYLLCTPQFAPTSAGYTDEERDTMLGSRWWTAAELAGTGDTIWPGDLPDLLPAVIETARGLVPDAAGHGDGAAGAGAGAAAGWPAAPLELPELSEDPPVRA